MSNDASCMSSYNNETLTDKILIINFTITDETESSVFKKKLSSKNTSAPFSIPAPQLPDPDVMQAVIGDSIAVAIVAFAISVSMVQLFAKRHNYESDSNQVGGLVGVDSINELSIIEA